jgi:hypothetical protein
MFHIISNYKCICCCAYVQINKLYASYHNLIINVFVECVYMQIKKFHASYHNLIINIFVECVYVQIKKFHASH